MCGWATSPTMTVVTSEEHLPTTNLYASSINANALNNTTVLAKREPTIKVRRTGHQYLWVAASRRQRRRRRNPLNRCYLSEPSYFKPLGGPSGRHRGEAFS
jgi:hypothetical protein